MAEGGEIRSKTTHRTPGQITRAVKGPQATPKERKKRVKRNKARAMMQRAGKVKKGDGKDVDHKRPLSKGGGNSMSNLRVTSRKKNRGHGMSPGGNAGKKKKY